MQTVVRCRMPSRGSGPSAIGIVQHLLQPLPQRLWKPLQSRGVDHAEGQHVEQVHLVFAAGGVEIHADERFEGDGLRAHDREFDHGRHSGPLATGPPAKTCFPVIGYNVGFLRPEE
jgi:hypothetical protein